jgi:hypothetical protein
MQTVSRVAADALDDELESYLPRLNARLNEHLDHRGLPDGVGLMNGTAGIHLVRLTDPANRGDEAVGTNRSFWTDFSCATAADRPSRMVERSSLCMRNRGRLAHTQPPCGSAGADGPRVGCATGSIRMRSRSMVPA